MSGQWKPGDVATVNDTTGGPERVAVCTGGGATGDARWNYGKGDVWSSVSQARRLVVIDPEDREQVERLRVVLVNATARPIVDTELQAALCEFANPTPPKPEEPTGLGAVVRDARGFTYVRGYVPEDDNYPWHVVDPRAALPRGWWRWDDIDAVEVLSEGVTP